MADSLRGITSPDLTRVVRAALRAGWRWVGYSGTTHAAIEWPATGERVTFGTTPGVASWKSTATEIERISGVTVWHKGNHKRSRKAVRPSGFNLYGVTPLHARQMSDRIEELWGEHHMLTTEFQAIADRAEHTRSDINRAVVLLRRIQKIEDALEECRQPVERFEAVLDRLVA